jgi:NTE family protein
MVRAGVPAVDLLARLTRRPLSPAGQKLLGHLGPAVQPPRPGRIRRPGTADSGAIIRLVDGIVGDAWPERPLWIVAVSARSGRRAVFGREGDPEASPGTAAAASSAVPGLFRPVTIEGTGYIDGGVRSVHSLDLVAGRSTDLVLVLAPMAHDGTVRSLRPGSALATGVRTQLLLEHRRVERAGLRVEVIAPDRGVRRVMGTDAMDPGRRRAVAEHVHHWMSKRIAGGDVAGLDLLL